MPTRLRNPHHPGKIVEPTPAQRAREAADTMAAQMTAEHPLVSRMRSRMSKHIAKAAREATKTFTFKLPRLASHRNGASRKSSRGK